MKKEIREFYARDDIHIEKMEYRGKVCYQLTKSQVGKAAERLFYLIQTGEIDIPTIERPWKVWEIAKNIKAESADAEDLEKEEIRTKAKLKLKKVHIIWAIITVVFAIICVAIAMVVGGNFHENTKRRPADSFSGSDERKMSVERFFNRH